MRLSRDVEPVTHSLENNIVKVVINSENGGRSVIVTVNWKDGSGSIECREWDESDPTQPRIALRGVGEPTWAWMHPEETRILRAEAARRK